MELICPAGTPAALKSAIDAGADAVYCGFNDETNARNFPGLNFSRDELREGIAHAHGHGARILVAINTFPRASAVELWRRAVDDAVSAGADALIVADIGLMDYVARRHPAQRLHVSVQAAVANPDAIAFYVEAFGARRVVLPRVLNVPEIAAISREIACETEVFVFGGLCVMAGGALFAVVLCHRQVAQHAGRVLPAEPRCLRTVRARDEFATGRLHHQPV
jgi:collagenase-like PrtC family protease